jgi:nucleoside-diphosphate-sugar epimerase
LAPLSLYAATKASSFHLLSAYAITHKMELYYPRLTNVYGIGAPENSFWCALRSAALEGSDFKMSIGNQIVDYIHVEEVAGKLLQACTTYDLKKGEPMVELLGSGRVQSLLDFAQLEWEGFGAVGRLLPGQYTG